MKSSELGYYFFQAVTFTIIRCVSSFVVLTLNARLECKCDISRKKVLKCRILMELMAQMEISMAITIMGL